MTEIPQMMTFLLTACTDNSYILADNLEGRHRWVPFKDWDRRVGHRQQHAFPLTLSVASKARFLGPFPFFLLLSNNLFQTVLGVGIGGVMGRAQVEKYFSRYFA